jgi:DNA-binding MarR family transcriptional regulator/energy-coupling factor transporter ATP-binding protein EcfA2
MVKFYSELLAERYSEGTIILIKTIAHRVYKQNKNALIITCGASGSGKSYVDLELLRGIHAYVNGEYPSDEEVVNRTFFKLKDFLTVLNSPEIQDPKTSRGQIYISEEVGTQASNRTHQNIANRAYSFIVQTFRAKGMIIFFNVPSFTFVDSQVRKQLHYLLETKMIDKNKKMCICKPLELQYNSRMDQIYFHNLKSQWGEKREVIEVDLISIPKIPDSLEEIYEKKKSEFINELNINLQTALDKIEEKEMREQMPKEQKPLTVKMHEAYELNQKGYKQLEIAKILGIKQQDVSRRLQSCEKRGYKVQKFQQNGANIIYHEITPKRDLNTVVG